MRNLYIASVVMALAIAGTAHGANVVVATNPERETIFVDRADCEKALGGGRNAAGEAGARNAGRGGSVFNRAAGNVSRCELIHGEYQIVVYPNPVGRRVR